MSAPLAISANYQAYPAGVAAGLGFQEYCWHSPEEEEDEEQCPEGKKGPLQDTDLSPVTSTSGPLAHYAPDSATSPNGHPPSPHLSSAPQRCKADSERGGKKSKIRTTFSQEQLQVLHHRFQSQKYLSPQQIRELGSALGLTYKQVKTWFQNQRMKFKRTQKETLWLKKGMCPPQASCLDFIPAPPQDYSMNPTRNSHPLANMHEGCTSVQSYGSGQHYPSDCSQLYSSPQSFYPIVGGENGGFFGKGSGPSYGQPAISYISQQKMNFYHGFSASVEYAAVKMEDGYLFPSGSAAAAALPDSSVLQHYQTPLQTTGAQSDCNP
ncbi:homeobox protein NANOG-like [Sphaerodactylus townsendi]|uniref:homeobox protein NANOG-like n=1 Tax=Sphaerodactylus townsendi TaxID=933632 RepID=UPI002026DE7E|nr:homeobox protein NANOG-like [Sphaerodactylus townsendi]